MPTALLVTIIFNGKLIEFTATNGTGNIKNKKDNGNEIFLVASFPYKNKLIPNIKAIIEKPLTKKNVD